MAGSDGKGKGEGEVGLATGVLVSPGGVSSLGTEGDGLGVGMWVKHSSEKEALG